MIFRTVLTTLFLTLCLGIDAQANESPIVRRIILMLAMATS